MLDYQSLLLAAALSGTCLSITMLVIWSAMRQNHYFLTAAVGLIVIAAHVIAFWRYTSDPQPWIGALLMALLPSGFALILVAAGQFYGHFRIARRVLAVIAASVLSTTLLMMVGLDGLAFMVEYAFATVLLVWIGWLFWQAREEFPALITLMTALFAICAASFALCGLVLLFNGSWVLGKAPDNWAERINIIVSVACLTALGALPMTMHNLRMAARHRSEALTDPLTGLQNRRALMDGYPDRAFGEDLAVVMFDLDHFKNTNDVYGHSIGDEVLKRFADVIRMNLRAGDSAFRLGGEEFALVIARVEGNYVEAAARSILADLAGQEIHTQVGVLRCTVSAGVAFGSMKRATLTEMLTRADRALYQAKRAGRNRVVVDGWITEQARRPALRA
ncbi:diguanylate cyclase [Mesorhizobium sp. UC22_110]|jgi:diguanylate cyclase (GGDEF)-like protein|uniref:GGDEF domain-containing protein n=1 Tax=unclassified Mesorhizobium TaxID=325217 RepID=UPI0036710030